MRRVVAKNFFVVLSLTPRLSVPSDSRALPVPYRRRMFSSSRAMKDFEKSLLKKKTPHAR
jgi:hypothetical protein